MQLTNKHKVNLFFASCTLDNFTQGNKIIKYPIDFTLTIDEIPEKSQLKMCTCKMEDLLKQGCKCGGK